MRSGIALMRQRRGWITYILQAAAVGCLLFCGGIVFAPGQILAHVLKVDGTISAVLHINPDDQPVSGTPTSYILFMNDSTGRFSLKACQCRATLVQAGRALTSQRLLPNAQSFPAGTFTFPEPGVYNLIITGSPTTPGTFQPFTLNYLERVTQGSTGAPDETSFLLLGACMGMAVAALVIVWFGYRYNKQQKEYL